MRRATGLWALGAWACGGGAAAPDLSLTVVPDPIVTAEVRPLLPDGAVLARSVAQVSVGLPQASYLAVWASPDPLRYSAGVVSGGALLPLPALHPDPTPEAPAPQRVGAVMVVQADADPAGELVVLLDRSTARPNRHLGTASQVFEAVVVDLGPEGFRRVPEWEAAVAGMSQPNEIRARLEPGATGF